MALKDMFKVMKNDLVKGVKDTRDSLAEKSRKTAIINRLRSVIKLEEARRDRAYTALGRYYYHNLRDEVNENTELHCAAIDEAEERIAAALAHLDEIYRENTNKAETAEEIDLSDVVEIESPEEEIDPVTAGSNAQFIDIDEETAKFGENDNLPFE